MEPSPLGDGQSPPTVPGSVLVSDDVDWSFAFIHPVTAFGVKPVVLTDGLGAVSWP
jgi:hypothetical protein